MENGGPLKPWIGILLVVGIFAICALQGFSSAPTLDLPKIQRTDIITIDTMKQFKNLERPAVLFAHDLHTNTLKISPKECTTCHLMKDNKLSLEFMRTEPMDRDTLMVLYHGECMKCHKEIAAKGNKTGPVECGNCHKKEADIISSRQPMELDKSLHYRHVKANGNKCEKCHHDYNEIEKKLYYAKGKEGSCRYCHLKQKEENRISMSRASHQACIECHSNTIKSGPVACNGCHDETARNKIEKIINPPRIKRNQPDAVFVKISSPQQGQEVAKEIRMSPVPFDHKTHEAKNNTCIVCHHKSLEACSSCHAVKGIEKGSFVGLEQAMHQPDAGMSCRGCHYVAQKDVNCAGCHASIQEKKIISTESCNACHIKSSGAAPGEAIPVSTLLADQRSASQAFNDTEVPEKVLIKQLSNTYEPVEMPHRKMIYALTENIKDNRLAAYFHNPKETLCQGCHHHSPPSLKPPHCNTCHGAPFNERRLSKPGLMGAYHIQCMECHKHMEIEKPAGCTECHREKTVSEPMITRKSESP